MSAQSQTQLRVTQVRSPIGRRKDQRQTLIGLGLNKINRSRVLEDTPSIRGMINKVRHLLEVEPLSGAAQTESQRIED